MLVHFPKWEAIEICSTLSNLLHYLNSKATWFHCLLLLMHHTKASMRCSCGFTVTFLKVTKWVWACHCPVGTRGQKLWFVLP